MSLLEQAPVRQKKKKTAVRTRHNIVVIHDKPLPQERPPPEMRLLRLPQVLNLVGMGQTAWLKAVRERVAPQPVAPIKGNVARAWVEAEIMAYIKARVEARDRGIEPSHTKGHGR
jgi:prophage regulatory protein